MGEDDEDAAALLRDLGTTRESLFDATRADLDDIGGTIRDLARRLRANTWRARDDGRLDRDAELDIARDVRDLVREHASAVAVLRALGDAPTLVGDAHGSLLDARLDAATLAMERGDAHERARAALQSAVDRVDRYAVAIALSLGRPIPDP